MSEDITSAGSAESEVTIAGAAISDGAHTLFVANFSDTDMAWAVYQELKSLEDGATVAIDGVIIVKRDADGALEVQKATDHSTGSGLKWGVVGGLVLGVLFPPSILGSAAVLGAAGAAGGKLRQRHHHKELAERLETAIPPGYSGLVALVSDPGAERIRKALNRANAIVESAVDDVTARDINRPQREPGPPPQARTHPAVIPLREPERFRPCAQQLLGHRDRGTRIPLSPGRSGRRPCRFTRGDRLPGHRAGESG